VIQIAIAVGVEVEASFVKELEMSLLCQIEVALPSDKSVSRLDFRNNDQFSLRVTRYDKAVEVGTSTLVWWSRFLFRTIWIG